MYFKLSGQVNFLDIVFDLNYNLIGGYNMAMVNAKKLKRLLAAMEKQLGRPLEMNELRTLMQGGSISKKGKK
jgi:hypothetical protein